MVASKNRGGAQGAPTQRDIESAPAGAPLSSVPARRAKSAAKARKALEEWIAMADEVARETDDGVEESESDEVDAIVDVAGRVRPSRRRGG